MKDIATFLCGLVCFPFVALAYLFLFIYMIGKSILDGEHLEDDEPTKTTLVDHNKRPFRIIQGG